MLKGMTGFAQANGNYRGSQINVEIRSVNHRFFECVVHLPEGLSVICCTGNAPQGAFFVKSLFQQVSYPTPFACGMRCIIRILLRGHTALHFVKIA